MVPSGAASPISNTNIRGLQRPQIGNGVKQFIPAFITLGREKFETERGVVLFENIFDNHVV